MVAPHDEFAVATEPTHERLPARALTAWRATSLLLGVPVVLVVGAVAVLVPGAPGFVRALGLILPGVLLAAEVLVLQPLRHRLWWYAIGDEEIDLRRGWPVTKQTAVPMVRVQHVDVEQGPLARYFKLADLRVNTAAGPVRIPSLDRDEADRIRRRIAELARIPDDL